ncbi:DUF58 domain-containing protein [Bartonella sp. HY038]|uniref:DUF58 domain-containing protein n=1 Tax=Bartonella sp. HY038 TaxID=2759660 RepID=UPI0015FC029C|nr:DUF58 domain-containing protein [Bartonella sp. HY038]
MRPSIHLITLVLGLTVATIIVAFWFSSLSWLLPFFWAVLMGVLVIDALVSLPPKRIGLIADLPKQGFVGQDIELVAQIFVQKDVLPKDLVMRLDLPLVLVGKPEFNLSYEQGAKETASRATLLPTKRGKFKIPALWLKWSSKLSLLEFLISFPINKTIDIVPDISPVLSGAIYTQIYPLAGGQKDMKTRGDGSEFHQLREFSAGMDPRSIDWKRSARTRSLIVRETRIERNHQIVLCIDSGRLMAEQLATVSKLDCAINSALAMCWASGIAGDNVGFYSFDSRPRIFIPPAPGRNAFSRIQKTCAQMQYETRETNHTLGLTQLATKLKKRSLVIIFSDFVDTITAELMIENMQVLTRQHLVVYIAMKDPILDKMTKPEVLGLEPIARAVSAHNIIEERRAVLEKLNRMGVLCLDSAPELLTTNLISRYIDIKLRGMI